MERSDTPGNGIQESNAPRRGARIIGKSLQKTHALSYRSSGEIAVASTVSEEPSPTATALAEIFEDPQIRRLHPGFGFDIFPGKHLVVARRYSPEFVASRAIGRCTAKQFVTLSAGFIRDERHNNAAGCSAVAVANDASNGAALQADDNFTPMRMAT